MKVAFTSTINRDTPSNYPPIGVLSMMGWLRRQGLAVPVFHNLDATRPTFDRAVEEICEGNPDIVGISAVVSTSYAFVKRLAQAIRARKPDTLIVVGGNMASCAELLLRRCAVDLCVIGEGEVTICKIVEHLHRHGRQADWAAIPNLVFLDSAGNLVNTGYEDQLPNDKLYHLDWADLEQAGPTRSYFQPMFGEDGKNSWAMMYFSRDPRTFEPGRRDKWVGQLVSSKGCVARCTYCHRFTKGIRYIPVDTLMERIAEVKRRYNVGFVVWGDENFGTDKRWLAEFCEKIVKQDVMWAVGGMRTNAVTEEHIEMMRKAGCSSIVYGMESGSDDMLAVMEKKITVDDNRKAMKWTLGAGMQTVIQLVLGMPGESPRTIKETIDFCNYATTITPDQDPNLISSSYTQALPGTPIYAFARSKGIISADLDGEENYLLSISDKNTVDEVMALNFTDYPDLDLRSWRGMIRVSVNYNYVKTFGIDHYRKTIKNRTSRGLKGWMERHPVAAYHLRHALPLQQAVKATRRLGVGPGLALLGDWLWFHLRPGKWRALAPGYRSLRRVAREIGPLPQDPEAMHPLRDGR